MTEIKTFLHIGNLSLTEINNMLSLISNRLDEIQGYRGNPKFYSDVTLDESELKYTDPNGTVLHSFGGT